MADTKVAIRRLPFEINTKLIFAQATVPPQWQLDTSDDDRFLRLVDSVGAITGGPNNTTSGSTNLAHTHTQSHYHNGYHTHALGHTHTSSDTDGMTTVEINNQSNYRCKDNGSSSWGVYHMRVDGGSNYEGHHDHEIGLKSSTFPSGSSNTGGPLRPSNGVTDNNVGSSNSNTQGASVSLSHNHTITNFKFAYTDVIVGTLVG